MQKTENWRPWEWKSASQQKTQFPSLQRDSQCGLPNSSNASPFMQKPSHLAKLCTYSVVTPLDYLLVETSKERLWQKSCGSFGQLRARGLIISVSAIPSGWTFHFFAVCLHFHSRELLADSSSLSPRTEELWYQKWLCSFQWCWTPLLRKTGDACKWVSCVWAEAEGLNGWR